MYHDTFRTFITFHIQIPYAVNQDYIKLVPILAKYAMVPVQLQFSFLAGGGYTVQILDLSLLRWLTLVLQSKHDFLDFYVTAVMKKIMLVPAVHNYSLPLQGNIREDYTC